MLAGYRLTSEAASDLKGILDYTLDRWGAEQADKYVLQIERCLHDLVSGRPTSGLRFALGSLVAAATLARLKERME